MPAKGDDCRRAVIRSPSCPSKTGLLREADPEFGATRRDRVGTARRSRTIGSGSLARSRSVRDAPAVYPPQRGEAPDCAGRFANVPHRKPSQLNANACTPAILSPAIEPVPPPLVSLYPCCADGIRRRRAQSPKRLSALRSAKLGLRVPLQRDF